MSYFLRVGDSFELYEKKFKIFDIGPEMLKAQRADDLVMVNFRINSLLGEESLRISSEQNPEAVSPLDPGFDALNEEIREEVRKKYRLIEPFALFFENPRLLEDKYPDLMNWSKPGNLNLTELIKRRACQLREKGCLISERKLWKLWGKWKHGGLKGLVDMQGTGVSKRRDNNLVRVIDFKTGEVLQEIPCRLSPEQARIVEDIISGYYLKPLSPDKAGAYEKIKGTCMRLNVPEVCESTVYRILSRIDERYLLLYREGKKEHDKKYRHVEVRKNVAQGPLHIVDIDHTLLDIMVVDDDRTGVVGRPWITVGIDEYSRMPWCVEIGWEHPSAKVVARAIHQGVLPKKFKEKYGTENELEVFGIPSIIYCDNGKEFHSKELQRIVEQELRAELRYRPPRTPNYGGKVERFFKTLNTQLIHWAAGTTKSNPKKIGDRDPEKEACITLPELKELVNKYITDVYPYQEHRGLPKDCPLPSAYYQQGLEKWGLPRVVPAAEQDNLWLKFLPEERRKICREGIRLDNIFYSSEQTKAIVGYPNQKLKRDPYDVSYIYLFHPVDNKWLKVPASNPAVSTLEGITELEWGLIQKTAREKGNQLIASTSQNRRILEIREEMAKKIEGAKRKMRKARRQDAITRTTSRKTTKPRKNKEEQIIKLNEIVKPLEAVEKSQEPEFKRFKTEDKLSRIQKTGFKKW